MTSNIVRFHTVRKPRNLLIHDRATDRLYTAAELAELCNELARHRTAAAERAHELQTEARQLRDELVACRAALLTLATLKPGATLNPDYPRETAAEVTAYVRAKLEALPAPVTGQTHTHAARAVSVLGQRAPE